ncbi:MAG: DUF433 domain-containing protein [Bryobacteraceae bacterium]|jgi:uncharacterized protein (DUF433 family)
MPIDYVEQREGGYYIAGSRVSLESVVYAFLRGDSAEAIAESFPSLTLEQVYGALACYLAQRNEIDAYLDAGRVEFERLRSEARRRHPALYARIEAARDTSTSPHG